MKETTGSFKGKKDFTLHYRCWLPDEDARAVLIIAHGVAEHSGRYKNVAVYFASRGYAVFSFDYRGHGKSEGARGYVERFSYYQEDLQTFFQIVRNLYPEKKVFMLGHSMGALVSLSLAGHQQTDLAGLILTGLAIRTQTPLPMSLTFLLRPLSLLMPKLGMKQIDSSILSRDKAVIQSYQTDPLVYRGKLSARLGVELLLKMQDVERQASQIQIPVIILHGSADKLSYPEGARIIYDRILSKDKTLKYYPGFYHEILNEPEHMQVFSDMENWLNRLA